MRFATPLITKSDGTKYGKTEGGALWLDPEMLSPYAFHQFWLNVEDEKVGELLRVFTFLSREEIEDLEQQTAEKPFLRAGQKRLADEVTALVHGADEVEQAKAAAAALFGGGDLAAIKPDDARLRADARQEVRRSPPASCPASSTSSWPQVWRRARGRRVAPSPRAAPTSTTCASRTPSSQPDRGRPGRRFLARAAPRQEEVRGRRGGLTGRRRAGLRSSTRRHAASGPPQAPQQASDLRKRRVCSRSQHFDLRDASDLHNVLFVARERRGARPVRSGSRPRAGQLEAVTGHGDTSGSERNSRGFATAESRSLQFHQLPHATEILTGSRCGCV